MQGHVAVQRSHFHLCDHPGIEVEGWAGTEANVDRATGATLTSVQQATLQPLKNQGFTSTHAHLSNAIPF